MSNNIAHLNPPELGNPSGYGFNHIVTVPSDRTLIFIAGQGGRDAQGNMGNFQAQLKGAFSRLRAALAAVGATPEQVEELFTPVGTYMQNEYKGKDWIPPELR